MSVESESQNAQGPAGGASGAVGAVGAKTATHFLAASPVLTMSVQSESQKAPKGLSRCGVHRFVRCEVCDREMRIDNLPRHMKSHAPKAPKPSVVAVVPVAPRAIQFEWRGPEGESGGVLEVDMEALAALVK